LSASIIQAAPFLALTVYYRNEGLVKDELSQKADRAGRQGHAEAGAHTRRRFRAAHMVSAAMPGVLTNTPDRYEAIGWSGRYPNPIRISKGSESSAVSNSLPNCSIATPRSESARRSSSPRASFDLLDQVSLPNHRLNCCSGESRNAVTTEH
jgi:hypothetical protein